MGSAELSRRIGSRSAASPAPPRSGPSLCGAAEHAQALDRTSAAPPKGGIAARQVLGAAPQVAAVASAAAGAAAGGEPASDAEVIHQVYVLSGARGVFQASRLCMGPLIVCMSAEFGYSTQQKGQILSAFAAGYALTQVVGGMAADCFGGAPLIMFGLVTSALALFLLPVATEAGFVQTWWLLWAMGFTQGPTFPAQLVATGRWVNGSLRSYASALGAAGSTAGALVAWGVTPVVASRLGWRRAAQLMGAITLLFGLLWSRCGRSEPPGQHAACATAANKRGSKSLTWSRVLWRRVRLLTALPVLAVYFAHSVHNFVRYFLTGWMPTYYHDILHASPDNAAVQLMIPDVIGLLMSFVAASVGRRLQQSGRLSALGSRRLFASISFVGAAVGLAATSKATSALGVTACQCFVAGLATLQGLGYGANYLDVSKHHGGLVTGVGNTVATVASYASPVFASWVLTRSGDTAIQQEDWQRLFLAFAASSLLGVVVFVPLCSVKPVDEDEDEAVEGETTEMKKE